MDERCTKLCLDTFIYWPALAIDFYAVSRSCAECAQERVTLSQHSKELKLFPAKAPLESVSSDTVGDLVTT